MGYKWLPVTEDFDRSLAIKKWRYDVNNPITGNYDGALAELPNIAVEGKSGHQMSGPTYGYAFENRFNAGTNYFSNRYYGWTDQYWTATTTSHTTLVEGTIYEFECPVDLYWAGIWGNVAFNPNLSDMMWFYVESSTFEIQPEEESALYTSGTTTITLTADEGLTWTASTTDNWLTLSTSTGTGSANITLSYTENKAPQPREGIVTFTSSEGDVLTYTITQDKRPLFIYNRPIYRSGSIVKKMYRSGELIYVRIGDAPIPPLPTGLTDFVGWFEDNFNDIASGGSMFNKIYVNTGLTTGNESFALLGRMTGDEYALSFNNGVFSVNNTAVTATTSLQGNDYYVYDFGERLYVESISPVVAMIGLRNSAMSFYQTEGVVAIYIEEKDCSNSYSEWGYESTEDCNCQKYGVDCGSEEDVCEDWENMGYVDYEDCRCNEYGECGEDPCDNWENDGYGSYEECQCLLNGGTWEGESCVEDSGDACEFWEEDGYSSYEDCRCRLEGENCGSCEDWEYWGYTSFEDCRCQEDGECGDPEEE